jgi:hypothetical protein
MAPISNDLLLAAALTSAVPAALAQPAPNTGAPRTGVATTVKAGAPRSSTTMYIDGTTNQRLTTDANSTMHVLFSDQSAVTLGPNSEMTIAKYEFNPQAKEGQILLEMTKGLLRVVGGLISKKTETVVRTSTATIGIRGGVATAEVNGGQTSVTFLFGQQMRTTDTNGNTQNVTRPGFGVTAGGGGISPPTRTPSSILSQTLSSLDSGGRQSGSGTGNTQPPGAPPGQLLSTSNIPGGSGNPASSLSNDRLSSTSDNRVNVNNSASGGNLTSTLQNVLTSRPTIES